MDGLVSDGCPILYSDELDSVMKAHDFLSLNHCLPGQGGWGDQPAVLMDLLNVYTNEVRQCHLAAQKK